ncbi:MAG: LacI family DNA-binding transcriptional regulator [Pseudomonadota bacterium]
MAITLRDVAERAGVSRSAVSRAFTDGASVSTKMRSKVERAARELGYHPNALASSLTTGRTKLIGLISNNFHNPIFLEVFDLFTRGLQDRGLRPLLVNLSDEIDPEKSVRMVQQYSVDGVIVASSTLSPTFARAFKEAGIPVVHSFGRHTTSPQVHVVGIDNVESGRIAAQELVACGYTDIAFLGGPETATSTQDRYAGFTNEVAKHTGVTMRYSFASAYSFDAGRDAMESLMDGPTAQAYFCGDDVLTIGALSALKSAGKRVPEDVGLIGLNDMEMARWQNIDISTIHQPIAQIVRSSIELVVSMLDDPERYPEARLFPVRVVRRGTLPKPIG